MGVVHAYNKTHSQQIMCKLLLDQEDKKHKFPYVGKLVEKVAINRFSGHVDVNDLDELLHSQNILCWVMA